MLIKHAYVFEWMFEKTSKVAHTNEKNTLESDIRKSHARIHTHTHMTDPTNET